MKTHDVVVIGAGPGGYVAAIRCAQLGLKTVCVDKWLDAGGKPALGGTCLNVGCIPSKALLDSSHHYHNLQHLLPAHGIRCSDPSIDIRAMQKRKEQVVSQLTRGIGGLFRKNKVEALAGSARLRGGRTVEVALHDGKSQTLEADSVIIASGSVPIAIPAAPFTEEGIVDSEGALALEEVPPRLGVIGAGVIGLELGSVWRRLGSQVVILEALEDFLVAADRQVAGLALKGFVKQGLDIRLGSRVTECRSRGGSVTVKYENAEGTHAIEVDKLVVAVGRRAYCEGLDAEDARLALDDGGRIAVDEHCRTSLDGVYAIGDCVAGPMLAHKASEEGVAVAERIAGQPGHIDHRTIPWVIYTHPEIAWVGRTEAELERDGIAFRNGAFPFIASGRAQAGGETEGLVKMIGDAKTDELLGVHVYGPQASELIAEAVTAMTFRASTEDLARTVHAHPTLAEALHEAALAVDKRALHF